MSLLAFDYWEHLGLDSRNGVDEYDRLRKLHDLIERMDKLQQDTQKLVAELTRQLKTPHLIAKIDRRKNPR